VARGGEQQQGAECVHVDRRGERLLARSLFGRHADRRAHDLVGGGEGEIRLCERSQTEVDDLRAVWSEQYVRRLEVPVEEILLVHLNQRLGDHRAQSRRER
jgi:hypothetical protein